MFPLFGNKHRFISFSDTRRGETLNAAVSFWDFTPANPFRPAARALYEPHTIPTGGFARDSHRRESITGKSNPFRDDFNGQWTTHG